MSTSPLFWVKRVEHALEEMRQIPLWGTPPAFPWDACVQKIGAIFQSPNLRLSVRATRFLPKEEVTSGLGTRPIDVAVELTPLSGEVHWLMSEEDLSGLLRMAISPQAGAKNLSSAPFKEGFYRFLSMHIAEAIGSLQPFGDLSLKVGTARPLLAEGAFCIDVAIEHPKQTIWGRIVCPTSFHRAFIEHFKARRAPLNESPLAEQVELELSLEIGKTLLHTSQWNRAGVGDFILLDTCSYDPATHKGSVLMALGEHPLLRARVKENSLKIVDYAFYYEESMIENQPENESTPSESEEFPSIEAEQTEPEEPLWTTENQDNPALEDVIRKNEVPLTLTVEAGRLKISLEKLLQLQPGNVLDMGIHPDQGVTVLVGGKKVATAELVKIGDLLGIKILRIGV